MPAEADCASHSARIGVGDASHEPHSNPTRSEDESDAALLARTSAIAVLSQSRFALTFAAQRVRQVKPGWDGKRHISYQQQKDLFYNYYAQPGPYNGAAARDVRLARGRCRPYRRPHLGHLPAVHAARVHVQAQARRTTRTTPAPAGDAPTSATAPADCVPELVDRHALPDEQQHLGPAQRLLLSRACGSRRVESQESRVKSQKTHRPSTIASGLAQIARQRHAIATDHRRRSCIRRMHCVVARGRDTLAGLAGSVPTCYGSRPWPQRAMRRLCCVADIRHVCAAARCCDGGCGAAIAATCCRSSRAQWYNWNRNYAYTDYGQPDCARRAADRQLANQLRLGRGQLADLADRPPVPTQLPRLRHVRRPVPPDARLAQRHDAIRRLPCPRPVVDGDTEFRTRES